MSKYRIVPFNLSHIGELLELERLVFPRDAYSRDFFVDLYAECGEWFLIALAEKRLAGYIVGSPNKRGSFELISIAVHPDFQRQRAGSALLTSLLRAAGKLEPKRIELLVRPANQAAIDFYRKFGFKRIGRIPRYYEDGSEAVRMVQQPVKRPR